MTGRLTTAEAGELLGVSASRVRQLILAGRLPFIKRGHDLWVNAAAVRVMARRPRGRPPKVPGGNGLGPKKKDRKS